jgi:hypothetical protein
MFVQQHSEQTIGRDKTDKAARIVNDRQRALAMLDRFPGGLFLVDPARNHRRIFVHDVLDFSLGRRTE